MANENKSLLDQGTHPMSRAMKSGAKPRQHSGGKPIADSAGVKMYREPQVDPYDNPEGYTQETIDVEKPVMEAGESVESRVGSILDENSELMQRAGNFGRMQAGQTGAGSSSMAARAAQSSIMDVALPIAQQDAQTAAKFKELGFNYDAMLGQMNEAQKLKFEELDKTHSLSQEILKNTQDFQRWSLERGWSEELTGNMMKLYSSVAQQGLAGMANMAGSQQVTSQEGKDFTQAWKDAISSLTAISNLDLAF